MSTTAVTLFAGPGTLHCAPSLHNGNGNILFNYVIDGTIRTLSNTNSPTQQSFKGLLYVPDFDTKDTECTNITAPYIPQNATRLTDLPFTKNTNNTTIALAPWVTRDCAQAYLTASQEAKVEALIFYHPESRDSVKPPAADNSMWDLGDNGQWKKEYNYPVYAVSGPAGTNLMHQLSQYSGRNNGVGGRNESEVQAQSIEDCARLYTLIDLEPEQSSTVPGIWVFALAILGMIILVMILAYIALRHLRRKRRETLQRRLVSGEIDLEYLGITRLVVPPHILSSLPVYVYPVIESEPETTPEKTEEEKNKTQESQNTTMTIITETQDETLTSILEEITPPAPTLGKRKRRHHTLTFSQNTCAICLDDFVPGSSLIRELPCTHIFHPECIDTFLMRDGSTCPLCKHNVLPGSFIEEQVSGLLVRREERARRLRRYRRRSHGENPVGSPVDTSPSSGGVMDRFWPWLHRDYENGRGVRSRPDGGGEVSETDLQVQRPPPVGIARGSEESYGPERREMMQRRAMVLLGTPVTNRA
ncbi:RING finger domain protein, putative [Talaromyces stipitatus ATCC 10500]|uniref:RING-type E3 ubiquitin transferase n=1 Tax=Talaromyces stipitatus (strain ATCC 10500 / CBS 375.48 / QM 6759 / NRRL 1006) TaxID=441959 RepID=B8MGP6_TALSN|nr:RING finger domain protein, putative [Talaromyces stipitatus ATCC 10500]EED16797.1 RING finger domain protein, putative [Talaromyces stipitatus ATCC 10500]